MKQFTHWMGGKAVPGTSGRTSPLYDPAAGEQIGEVQLASVEEVRPAVESAEAMFPAWRATSLTKRADVMFRLRQVLDDHRGELAALVTAEHRQGAFRRGR